MHRNFLLVFFLFFNIHDLFFVIVTAVRANPMTLDQFMAVGALDKTGRFDFPISRAGIPPGLGNFTFRYCHIIHLLFVLINDVHDYLLYGKGLLLSTILTNNFAKRIILRRLPQELWYRAR